MVEISTSENKLVTSDQFCIQYNNNQPPYPLVFCIVSSDWLKMGGGSGESHSTGGHHSAHGSAGKASTAYPDRYPNSCEFRIPGKNQKLFLLFSYSKSSNQLF